METFNSKAAKLVNASVIGDARKKHYDEKGSEHFVWKPSIRCVAPADRVEKGSKKKTILEPLQQPYIRPERRHIIPNSSDEGDALQMQAKIRVVDMHGVRVAQRKTDEIHFEKSMTRHFRTQESRNGIDNGYGLGDKPYNHPECSTGFFLKPQTMFKEERQTAVSAFDPRWTMEDRALAKKINTNKVLIDKERQMEEQAVRALTFPKDTKPKVVEEPAKNNTAGSKKTPQSQTQPTPPTQAKKTPVKK